MSAKKRKKDLKGHIEQRSEENSLCILKDANGADYFIPTLRLSTWVKASNNTSSNLKGPQRDIKLDCLRNFVVKAHLCSQHHHMAGKQSEFQQKANEQNHRKLIRCGRKISCTVPSLFNTVTSNFYGSCLK